MGLFDDLTPGNAGSFADLIPKPKPRGLLGFANDTVISAANQIAGGVGSIASAIVPGNRLSQFIDEDIVKAGEDKQSDIVKQSRARFQAEMEAAQGGWDEAAAVGRYVADNPMQTLAQAAGALALVGLPISGIGKFVTGLRTGMGATEAAAAATAAKVSSGAGAALGGLMSGGDAAGTAYELVQKTPLDTLMLSPQAQELSKAGLDEKAIRDELGTRAARAAMPIPTLIGAVSGLIGAERILAGGKPLAGGALARGAQTALVEGGGEFVDEAATQYFGQKGAAEYNPTIDPTKGVVGAGLLGMALGAPTGGVVGALSKGRDPLAEAVPPGAPDPVAKVLDAGSIDEAIAAATAATSAPALGWNQRWEPEGGFAGQAPLYVFPDGSAATREEAADVLAAAAAQRNIEAWVARSPRPMPQEEAQALAAAAQERTGKAMSTLPLPDGKGWTVVPSAWVSHPSVAAYIEQASAAVDAESARQARIAEAGTAPVDRAARTGSTAPLMIDTAAPNAVEQFIQRQSQINTPAARAFVQEFRAGRITADDVMDLLVPSRLDPTPDARLAAAAAQAPKTTEGYLLTQDGFPYGSRIGAQARANKEGGEVVRVEGGFAVKPAEAAPVEAAAPVAAATPASSTKFDPQGLKPGTPEYETAFQAWSERQTAAKAAGNNQRQRDENKTALEKRNAWRKRVRDWFLAASDGDTITDTGTGTTYKVVVKKRVTGQTIKTLVAVDENGTPLPDGKAATGIGAVDQRVDGLDDASLDQETGSTTPETAGASLAASLGMLLESGDAVASRPAPAAPRATESAPAAAPAAPRVGGFTPAPNGYKVRVSQHENGSNALDPTADVGAFIYEVRKGDDDRNPLTMVLNKDGKLVPAQMALDGNKSNGTAWVPPSAEAAAAVRALLEKRAGTNVGSPERAAVDAEIAAAVKGGPTAPAAPAAPQAAESAPAAPAPTARKTLQESRTDAALDKQVRDNGEQMTRRQWVERKVAEGLKTRVTQEDRIKPMSRMQFFRANNEEQRAHERKIKAGGKKDVFWIGDYEVTKTEHDYAERLAQKTTAPATPAAAAPTPAAPQLLRKATNPERMSERLRDVAFRKLPEQVGTENRYLHNGPQGAGFYRVPKGWKAEAPKPSAPPAPLYASRPVTNAADIMAWAASQGFKSTLPADDLHVTVAYSREPVAGDAVPGDVPTLTIRGGKRTVEPLGDEGAVVLKFTSPDMQARWKQYREAGASWDYESYTPHVTITYDGKGVDLSKVKPYDGPITLGAEKQEALNVDKADDYKGNEEPAAEPAPPPAAEKAPQAEATHKDPGEPAEPVTAEVVKDAIATAAENRDRPIKDVKADALRLIDAAIEKAPSSADIDATIGIGAVHTDRGKKVMTGSRGLGDGVSVVVEARETRDGKWSVTDESYDGSGTGRKRRTVLGELAGTPAVAREQLMSLLRRLREDGTVAEPNMVTIRVPGDGEFKVENTKERLAAFRKRVEASSGFKTQRPGPTEAERVNGYGTRQNPGSQFGVEDGSGSKVAAFENMVNDGDLEAASDYADAVGLVLDPKKIANASKVLKWREGRPDVAEAEGQPMADESAPEPTADTSPTAPEEAKPAEPQEAKAPETIQDIGEKIGGARKDRWKERGLAVSDLDEMTDSEGATLAVKANVWKPDYAAITAQSDPVTAAMVKIVYDSLAAKPKSDTPQGRRDYVTAMQAVRKVYGAVTSPDEARNAYEALRTELGVRKKSGAGFVESADEKDAKRVMFSVYKGRSDPFVFGYNELARARDLVKAGFPDIAPWKRRFVIRQQGGAGSTTRGVDLLVEQSAELGTPVTADQVRAGVFAVRDKMGATKALAVTREDAEAAAAAIYERTKGGDEKEEPNRPHLDAIKRAGLKKHIDRDVTSEDFMQAFGWRGVEFGNWAAQDERQRLLNLAYDSLMDLAEILNVPPRALSLNGTMGLAFGARGGGRFAAHYEPGKLVINMTKLRGAGSLAHEWGHAVDHYLGELDRGDAYKGNARGASGWYSQQRYTGKPEKRSVNVGGKWTTEERMRLENLRPELAAAVDTVMKRLYETPIPQAEAIDIARKEVQRTEAAIAGETDPKIRKVYEDGLVLRRQILADLEAGAPSERTRKSSFAEQAQRLSGKSSDGYWIRPTEMFARSFESYVFDRLVAMGAQSDYLVHGVEQDRYSDGTRYKGNPYPTGEERQAINAAFDTLVGTLKTRETNDGNVAIFSRAPSVNLALEASDAAGREFWRKIDNGESFTDQEVLDALSINRRGSRRTARGVAGTSGQASVGESVVRWADPIAGGGRADQATEQAQPDAGATGEQAQDVAFLAGSGATGEPVIRWAGEIAGFEGYRTSAAWDGDGFTVFVVPEQLAGNADLSDPEQARGKAIVSYAFTLARDGRYEVSVNDVVADGEAEQALEARGTLRKVGTTDNPYGRIEIGRTMSVALLQESVRRLALNIGKTPDVFYPSRDTGARAGLPDTERSFSADTLREKFSRGPGLRGKVSVRDARAMADELRTAFPRAPQIRILEKVNQAPRALLEDIRAAGAELDVEAAFHKGEIYVFPGNIDSIERLRHVMTKHEIRHAGFRGLLGEGMDRTMLALYEANATVRKAADAKLAARLAGSKAEAVDEALADMTPEDIAAMTGARPLLAKLRLALRRLAGRLRAMGWTTVADAITPSGWSDADVVALVLKAESMALRGETDGTRFSRAPAVLSEAFRRWFAGSKVVDADGKPLVVYHGTDQDFTEFRHGDVGFHFGPPEAANNRLDNEKRGDGNVMLEPRVMPVYLSIKNPLRLKDAGDWGNPDQVANVVSDAIMEDVIDGDAYDAAVDAKDADSGPRVFARIFERMGYDGIVYDNVAEGGGDSYIAFRPEQIKSATGNAGTYDRTNPDIRYSRRSVAAAMADTINSVRDVSLPAGYKVADLLDSHGKITAWDKTVGTPFNLAKRHPGTFGKVYDRVQQFLNDISHHATEAADLAPSILPKLESLKDITKSPLSAADTKAIAAPIFEGTLTWTRDRMGKPIRMEVAESRAEAMSVDEKASELLQAARIDPKVLRMWQGMPIDQYEAAVTTRYANEMLRPGVVWTDAELRSMFKLGDAQIKLYRQFRASIDRSLDDLTKSEMIRMGGKDVAGMADALQAMSVTEARNAIADRLREVAETDDGRAKALDKAAQAVADLGTKAADLKARGYAPLTRFGSYTLDVVDAGERVYFGMFESQYEANRMQRKMREQFPRATIRQGTQDTEAFKMFAGISPETIELFGEILGLDSTGDEASDKAFQTFLQKARSTRSAMKRLIHRKGIDGFSEDAGRVLAGFLTSNARRTSSNMHLKGILDAVEEIPQQQGELKTYAAKMVDYVQNPVEEAAALRGLLFAQYLGGSIASALVNMSQPIMVSVPYLSQYGGAKQAAAAMVRAMKDMASGAKLEPALAKALKAAEEDGVVAPQEMHQLQAQARGQAALRSGDGTKAGDAAAIASNTLSRASLAWGKLFGFAELVNRRSTYIAAYRVGRAQGMADPDAFARQAVVETQFTYNKGNRPQWARGAIGATLFTFKTYSVSYVELLSRMAKSGPDGRRAALLAVALLLLMSGADGLPFMEDAEDVLDAFMQRIMGRNWSTKQKRNELLAEILGKDAGQFLQNGISGLPGVPIDVSGRMGMGNLIPGTGLLRKDSQPGRDMKELLGPVADLAERTGRAAGMVLQGDVGRAALEVSPVAARNVAKGADMIETGTYRDAKGRKVIDTTATEAIAKMAGFQPATVARVQEATNTVQRAIALNKTVEAEIADQWAQGLYEKDADKVAAARERLRDWNAANEDMPIKITFQQVRKRLQAMNQDKATRMEKTAPKEIRREIRRELAEAGR